MISNLAIARAAFRQSTTVADALLTVATTDLKLDNAPLQAADTALKTGGEPDIAVAEENVLDNLRQGVDKKA